MSFCANRDARQAIADAVRLHGHKRGWHLAALALGISDRTARAILDGTSSGATIHPDKALEARMEFRRARAAQLRAELEELENECGTGSSRGSAAHADGLAIDFGMQPNGSPSARGG